MFVNTGFIFIIILIFMIFRIELSILEKYLFHFFHVKKYHYLNEKSCADAFINVNFDFNYFQYQYIYLYQISKILWLWNNMSWVLWRKTVEESMQLEKTFGAFGNWRNLAVLTNPFEILTISASSRVANQPFYDKLLIL